MLGSALERHRVGRGRGARWRARARCAVLFVAAAALLGMGGCSLLLDFEEPDAGMDATPATDAGMDARR